MFTDVVIESDGATLAARNHGGAGPPVVLIHGLASNLAIWDVAGRRLATTHHVVAYDQRSHGLSSDGDGDFSYDALVRDLRAVIEHFGLEAPVIVGHSWGASVGLEHAASAAECPGVVCVDGGVIDMQGLGSTWEVAQELLRPPKLIGGEAEMLDRIRAEQSFLDWTYLEPVVRRSRVATDDGLTRPRLRFDDHMKIAHGLWAQRTWDLHARLSTPVMVVLARGIERNEREQGFVAIKQLSAERVREYKPDVRIEWLDSVHDIPIAHPNELVALVKSFTSSL